jgi:hypothetical protein
MIIDKGEVRRMAKNSMIVEVKVNVTNLDQFNDLVKMFNKKAHELEELAHKLNMFRFEVDILSNDGN